MRRGWIWTYLLKVDSVRLADSWMQTAACEEDKSQKAGNAGVQRPGQGAQGWICEKEGSFLVSVLPVGNTVSIGKAVQYMSAV